VIDSAFLACPVCGADLAAAERTLRCAEGHSFDVARQGYVTLLARPARTRSDTAAMVAARERFLAAGHFAPLAARLAELAAGAAQGCVLDLGAGTGYYLRAVLDALPGRAGVALDLSKPAARRAAADPRITAVVADVWRELPVRTGAAGLALVVFAPRNLEELRRVLHPGGVVIVVGPGPDHLRELVEPLGLLRVGEDKTAGEPLELDLALSHAEVRDLVEMGPSAWHGDASERAARIAALPEPVRVRASFRLARMQP
jgi:23S rRNA (guanine745-N1)-methyltransferase